MLQAVRLKRYSYRRRGNFDLHLLRLYVGMYTADCMTFRVVLPLELACRQLYQRYGASANLASLLDHAACTLGERTTPVSSVPLAPVSAPSAAELVDNFSLTMMVTSARRLVAPPPPAQEPDREKRPTAMSPLPEFDPVADATSYLANDIPVPYYPDQEPETDWMAMKLEAVEDFLREQEVYSPSIRRTQPDPEPATASLTDKGKERARSPAVKTEPANDHGLPPATSMRRGPADCADSSSTRPPLPMSLMRKNSANPKGLAAQMEPEAAPAIPRLPFDCAPLVNLAARAETLHLSPRAASIEYLASRHPDGSDDDGSSDDEPSASKRPRLVSPTPSPQAPSPDYLALTPSEIDRLLHDARPFQYRFIYTPNHIRGIADDILRELSAFLSFYAPASEQEAAARIYLYRAFQSHFNRRL
ncbi:hypothetical protein PCASD_26032 [Puccinia coronata f. sp. avenae]|uniref:Uncharacterized protein n=1 Tax=Puccinia coronata f. sp. avenae TaxID=200324 RepID=A0A2N5RZ06_9BASI|nr:hypothetical protein PCASD_26032 [Puccinia coronata f. sp. avenae]